MSILDEFIKIAEGELGVHEIPGPDSNQRILEYNATTSLKAISDEVPWCSSFVNWVVRQAGLKGTDSASAKSWLSWGKEIKDPIRGCIAVLKRGLDPRFGHVTFFDHQTRLMIDCLGGNQSHKVCYSNYPKINVLSYRVPEDF